MKPTSTNHNGYMSCLYQQDDIFRGCQWGTKFFNGPNFQGFYPSRLAPCRPSVVNMAMDRSPIDGRFIFFSRVLYFSRKLRFFSSIISNSTSSVDPETFQLPDAGIGSPASGGVNPSKWYVSQFNDPKYWQSNLWHHSGRTKRAPPFFMLVPSPLSVTIKFWNCLDKTTNHAIFTTVDGCEILHQFIAAKHPIIIHYL